MASAPRRQVAPVDAAPSLPAAQWLVANWQVTAACLSISVIAALDLGQRADFPVASFYVAPVLLALWSQNTQHALYLAYAATVLSVIGFMRGPLGGPHGEEMATRVLSIAMVWRFNAGVARKPWNAPSPTWSAVSTTARTS